MYHLLDKFLTELPGREPRTYKAIYPKRIVPPHGYLNPKYFTITLWSQLKVGLEPEMTMLPHVTGVVNALLQVQHRVPTYFVRSEFAQAVAQTEPPADFKLGEIKWPLDAMLFVLPTDFVLKYFGFLCPFISITHSGLGIYPDVLKNLPDCDIPLQALNPIDNRHERFNVIYPVYTEHGVPVDYTGSYPLSLNVNQMAAAPFADATFMEAEAMGEQVNQFRGDRSDLPNDTEERAFIDKVQAFAVKLMLALTARPNFIQIGGLSRAQKIKKGKVVRDELWHPNLIGWEYQAQRVITKPTSGDHGTHASPRMHWRRGHMRNQPFGPKPWTDTSTKRLTWIEPVLISAPDEETKA